VICPFCNQEAIKAYPSGSLHTYTCNCCPFLILIGTTNATSPPDEIVAWGDVVLDGKTIQVIWWYNPRDGFSDFQFNDVLLTGGVEHITPYNVLDKLPTLLAFS
jgi:hypothetical protein